MLDMGIRLLVIVLLAGLSWLLVRSGQHFVSFKQQKALAATPLHTTSLAGESSEERIRILAFSSADCRQCKPQAAILRNIAQQRDIAVITLDAATEPELAQRYQILTVPTTVILDTTGKAQAVNYGLANTQRLLAQLDALK